MTTRYQKVLDDCLYRLTESPDDAQQYAQAASLLTLMDRATEAEKYWHHAISLDPLQSDWHLELARLLREHHPHQACDAYAQAASLGCQHASMEAIPLLPSHATSLGKTNTIDLWTTQRLDIAIKLLYAKHHLGYIEDPAGISIPELYRRHILLRTQGREPGTLIKQHVDDYEQQFIRLINAMQQKGFQPYAAIPVHEDGRILNGAHRLAAALALGINVVPTYIPDQMPAYDWGMQWFLQYDFQPQEINLLLKCWLEYKKDQGRIALLWHTPDQNIDLLMREINCHMPVVAWRDLWLPEPEIHKLQKQYFNIKTHPLTSQLALPSFRMVLIQTNNALNASPIQALNGTTKGMFSIAKNSHTLSLANVLLDDFRIDSLRQQLVSQLSGKNAWISKNMPIVNTQ